MGQGTGKAGRWIGIAFALGVVVLVIRAATGNLGAQAMLLGSGRGLLTGLVAVAITLGLLALPKLLGRTYKPGLLAFVIVCSIVMGVVRLLLPAVLGTTAAPALAAEPVAQESAPATPAVSAQGWTEENTGAGIVDPFQQVPTGTRYYRDAKGAVFKLYPPGVMPDAPPANPFGVLDSHEWGRPGTVEGPGGPPPGFVADQPSQSSDGNADPPGTKYVQDADGNTHRLVPYSGDYQPTPPPPGFVVDQQAADPAGPWNDYAPVCQPGFHVVGRQCWKTCPRGYHAVAANSDECAEDIKPIVERGFFGGCPTGYVDHPANPKQCVLPAIAERYYRRRE